MAIVAPSFLLMIFVIIEVALWMHARDVALAAAREGVADLRVVNPEDASGSMEGDIEARAESFATRLGAIQSPSAVAEYNDEDGRVTVTVEGDVVDLIPGWTLTVDGTASGLLEDFQPDLGPP
jgi:Flp pilus assembly protein TadG